MLFRECDVKIWINITELLGWRGNMTGIQRIEYNLAKSYMESDEDVHFFVHDEKNRRFREVEFAPDKIVASGIVRGATSGINGPRYVARLMRMAPKVRNRIMKHSGGLRYHKNKNVDTPFANNDLVIVVGSIWIGGFAGDLVEAKRAQGFKLAHFSFDMVPDVMRGAVVPWLPEVFIEYHKVVFSCAEMIICISQSTAQDVKRFLHEHSIHNSPVIGVVRVGDIVGSKEDEAIEGIDKGFILSVSTIEARKNHNAIFYLVREAHKRGIDIPEIVIVGRSGWHTEDVRYMIHNDPVAKERIRIINDVNDNQLAWLYKNCKFTVFPSFYEGWGMPIAESLSYGKLCLSSNTSSMPEIAGDLIDYFSPYDTGALTDLTIKYLNTELLSKKEKRIKKGYKPTSWDDMFNEVRLLVDGI